MTQNSPKNNTPMYSEVIDDFSEADYDFRINDLDETMEVKMPNSTTWTRFNDTHEAILKVDLMERGYGGKKKPALTTMLNCAVKLANSQRYNPIKDYFDALDIDSYEPLRGDHGPQPHIIADFAKKYFTNPDKYFGLWLFKWMVGALAKIYKGERNPMLVLVSDQGSGKSYFSKWLCPNPERFVKGGVNPDSKDHKIRINNTLVWEVEELGATTRRADIEALKGFITLPFTYERPAYKRHPIHKPAVCSFIGTVNHDGAGFLNDPTGSTRFLVTEIDHIDFSYTETNLDDLWREALWFFRKVEGAWQLSDEMDKARIHINSQYEMLSALEDAITASCDVTGDEDHFMTTQEIKDAIYGQYRVTNEQLFYNELARVCQRLGLKRGRSGRKNGNARGWLGIQKRPSEKMA